jgi:lysophospholipase L1-like esterase
MKKANFGRLSSALILRASGARRKMRAWLCGAVLLLPLITPPAKAAGEWRYTALGDSLAFGAFASIGNAYPNEYERQIEAATGVNAKLTNLGIPGWKSGDLLGALRGNLIFRYHVFRSQVVAFNIGGNDLMSARNTYKDRICGGDDNQACLRAAVATFKANWNGILGELLALRRTSNTIIRTMDVYNPFVNVDKAVDTWPNDQGNDFHVVRRYLDEVNTHIAQTATAANIPYANVYREFNGPNGDLDPADRGLIFLDGIHANTRGHRRMGELLGARGYAPLRQ